jgi:glutamyl-tRNA synthetase
VAWFGLEAVGKSAARFDFDKLNNLNGHYIRQADDTRLTDLVVPRLEASGLAVDATGRARVLAAMPLLKPRARTLIELAEGAAFLVRPRPLPITPQADKLLGDEARQHLSALREALETLAPEQWQAAQLEQAVQDFVAARNLRLKDIAQPLRAALTGSHASPGIFDVLAVLGREESLARIADGAARRTAIPEPTE